VRVRARRSALWNCGGRLVDPEASSSNQKQGKSQRKKKTATSLFLHKQSTNRIKMK
jgi:hypothetical protein